MANHKSCNHCNQIKPLADFYKMSASKDCRQPKCKQCCKVVNENFRDTNPKYQVDWQRANPVKWLGYVTKWANENIKADNSRSKIYFIQNELGQIYVGHTQTAFGQRKSSHMTQHRDRTASLPLLHQSFDTFGFDNHKWETIDMSGVDKETLMMIEYQMINNFNNLGISLNVRLK